MSRITWPIVTAGLVVLVVYVQFFPRPIRSQAQETDRNPQRVVDNSAPPRNSQAPRAQMPPRDTVTQSYFQPADENPRKGLESVEQKVIDIEKRLLEGVKNLTSGDVPPPPPTAPGTIPPPTVPPPAGSPIAPPKVTSNKEEPTPPPPPASTDPLPPPPPLTKPAVQFDPYDSSSFNAPKPVPTTQVPAPPGTTDAKPPLTPPIEFGSAPLSGKPKTTETTVPPPIVPPPSFETKPMITTGGTNPPASPTAPPPTVKDQVSPPPPPASPPPASPPPTDDLPLRNQQSEVPPTPPQPRPAPPIQEVPPPPPAIDPAPPRVVPAKAVVPPPSPEHPMVKANTDIKVTSPWTFHLEIIEGKNIITAKVGRTIQFKVVCEKCDMQSPHGTIQAAGNVRITSSGLEAFTEKMTINLQEDSMVLEGKAQLKCARDEQEIELRSDRFSLRLSEIQNPSVGTSNLQRPPAIRFSREVYNEQR